MSTAIKEAAVDTIVEETVEEVIERPYTLRKFNDGDLFPILKILKKIGILAAFDLADIQIGNLTKVEEEVFSLYSDMSGIAADEIRAMEFGTLPLMIMDSFEEVKNTAFFKVLSKLL